MSGCCDRFCLLVQEMREEDDARRFRGIVLSAARKECFLAAVLPRVRRMERLVQKLSLVPCSGIVLCVASAVLFAVNGLTIPLITMNPIEIVLIM